MHKPTYEELAAQVEVLSTWLKVCASLVNQDAGTAVDWLIENHADMESAAESAPAACLAQVRAEAGRKGFIAGYHKMHIELVGSTAPSGSAEHAASQYANRIRQEKTNG